MQRYDLDQCETKLKLLFVENAHLKIVKEFTGREFYKCIFSKKTRANGRSIVGCYMLRPVTHLLLVVA